MAEFALNPNEWKNFEWAQTNKLYQSVYSSEVELDKALEEKLTQLSSYSPDALAALKHSLWEGTEHYEELLFKRAEESGKLSLTENARSILTAFKNRRNA
jgi:methylglutaconyl-CoA hydratase